jgi:hypothetical protein
VLYGGVSSDYHTRIIQWQRKLDASWPRLLLVYICWDTYKFDRIRTWVRLQLGLGYNYFRTLSLRSLTEFVFISNTHESL